MAPGRPEGQPCSIQAPGEARPRHAPAPVAGHPDRHIAEHRTPSGSEIQVTSMSQYIALIHKEPDSDYGVSFPDFPGVFTAGRTLDEARAMAEEALAFHIEGLVADKEAVPEPSTLETIMADPTNRDGIAILVAGNTPA